MHICPQCHATVGADWRFCRYCGAPLNVPSAATRVEDRVSETGRPTEALPSASSAPPTMPAYLPPTPDRDPLHMEPSQPAPPSERTLRGGPQSHERSRRRFRSLTLFLVGVTALGTTILLATMTQVGLHLWRERFAPRWVIPLERARSSLQESAEFSRSLPLPSGSEVTLFNENGDVTITTWDEERAAITARKFGRTVRDLEDVRIEITREGAALAIRTIRPEEAAARVDYVLTLPRRVTLSSVRVLNGEVRLRGIEGAANVTVVNGHLEIEDLAGSAQTHVTNGRTHVALARCGDRAMRLESINGSISLTLPPACDAELEARTVNGRITADDDLGITIQEGRITGMSAHGRLGQGGPSLSLRTVNGAIRIRRQVSQRER